MYKRSFSALLLSLICLVPTAMAQEGHPLVGNWQGVWGASADERNFLTLIVNWDGKNITGLVNPGPGSTTISSAELDSSTWTVHFEIMNLMDNDGNTHNFVGEGTLEDIGSQNRTLNGTWTDGSNSGEFELTRAGGA